ncbi:flagellar motor protein MotB [Sphingobium boeckii]|uniref:Flagellar motor protein MotB n=1 Tax=Sphingobium boeckii TaxID=1082345 RepID=A0A7W9EEX1_9SPHN|nr:flagellar motor protein MotB [Sphingobium boeckii]MBB5686464.1 flagellar motor protein MotB [Sphingobium boeckii]
MKIAAQPRWLLSFADLILLLLAFFVMLHARESDADRIVQGIGDALGPKTSRAVAGGYAADAIFETGEAVLKPGAQKDLNALAGQWTSEGRVIVTSIGQSHAGARFDTWELSAARAAAVARHLSLAGIAPDAIDIDMDAAATVAGDQRITVRHRSR